MRIPARHTDARGAALALVAFWAVFAVPVACTAGVLAHACACEDETEVGCEHESECTTDPCPDLVVRLQATDAWPSPAAAESHGFVAVVLPVPPVPPSARGIAASRHEGPPGLGVLHASDHPLLS